MPTAQARAGAFSCYGPSGMTLEVELTWTYAAGVTGHDEGDPVDLSDGVSIWLAGSTRDLDDFTGATEYEATIASNVATVSLPVPAGSTDVDMRVALGGVTKTVGKLRPTHTGGTSSTSVDVLASESVAVNVEVLGTVLSADDAGPSTASELPFVPVGTIAATDTQAAVAEVASEAATALSAAISGLSGTYVPLTGFAETVQDLVGAMATGAAGGLGTPTTKTANYTAVSGDLVLVDATAGAVTITLPAAVNGRFVTVKKVDGTANLVTVTPPSGTVDGAASIVLSVQYQARTVTTDGTNWFQV